MSQSQRISQAERTGISDNAMIETAVGLIVSKGTDALTLKEVGEKAGYSRGLAGYRFGNKAGLFEAVFRAVATHWLGVLKRSTDGLQGYTAIVAAIDAHSEQCRRAPEQFCAFYTLWFESIGARSDLQRTVETIHQRRFADVANWIRADQADGRISPVVDADTVARYFCVNIVGIVYQWLLQAEPFDTIEKLYDELKSSMHSKLYQPTQRPDRVVSL